MVEFAFADELDGVCRHCATFARANSQQIYERGLIPRPQDETATVTFIRFEGRTYAVTARHVMEGFECLARKQGIEHEGYYLPAGKGIGLQPPFIVPPENWQGKLPDVALRQIDDALPAYIGKEAFELDENDRPAYPVPYALAVGFPTAIKSDLGGAAGSQLAMPCFQAVAEGLPAPESADQLQFFSEIENKPDLGSLSGLSGGPVFWSNGEQSGLIGFVKHALDLQPIDPQNLYAGPRVHFLVQHATYESFGLWAGHALRMGPKRVAELNEWARNEGT